MPSAANPRDEKTCVVCGRRMTWRKAWAKNWDQVRYCSDRCRRRGVKPVDADLESAILDLLDRRARGATICPSEAARAVDPDDWRELMEPARSSGAPSPGRRDRHHRPERRRGRPVTSQGAHPHPPALTTTSRTPRPAPRCTRLRNKQRGA